MSHRTLLTVPGYRRGSTVTVTWLVVALLALGVQQAPPAQAAPAAAKIAPAVMPQQGAVTIAGTELANTTGVTFLGSEALGDEVAAVHFIVLDVKKVVAQLPPGAVTGPIRLDSPDGATTTPVAVTIVPPPSITSLSMDSAPAGQLITITGENLMGSKKSKVFFGSKGLAPKPMTQTELTVAVPALPGGPVDLKVVTDGGTAAGTFYIAPTVRGIAPAVGTTAGGTIATITGSAFTGVDGFVDDPATVDVNESLDGVTIGGNRVTALLAVNDKEIVVEVPPGTDPAAPVVVRTKAGSVVGTSQSAATFKYLPLPAVTAMSPDWSTLDAPPSVTVTGTNLTDTTVVAVNGVGTPAVADPVAGTLTFTPPVSAKVGLAKVTFTNTDAGAVAYTTTVPLTYVAAPTVTKLAPISAAAGTIVTVAGTNFASNTTVSFGGTNADCTVVALTKAECTAPAGAGAVDVVATNGVGISTAVATSTFTYTPGTPATYVSKLAPAVVGPTPAYGAVGSAVPLKGKNLHAATKVEFSGPDDTWIDAPAFLRVGPGRLVVEVPSGVVTGEIRVTNPYGSAESKVRFVTSVRPSINAIDVVGDAAMGVTPNDLLKITGAGLVIKGAKTFVTIGGKAAPILAKPTPTAKTIVVKVPADVGGRGAVVVNTSLGTATSEISAFYVPEVKAPKPVTNSRVGGTIVTITGTGFTGTDDVTFGVGRRQAITFRGRPVSKWVFVNDKTLIAVTAPNSATADDLVVTSQHDGRIGDSEGTVGSATPPIPSVSLVSPNTGPISSQPPVVTLTGQHLTIDTVVKFGTTTATVQSAAPDGTSINVVPPVRLTTGSVPITLTNLDDGQELTATFPDAYTYELTPAVVSAMSVPTAVPGTSVTITGTSFVDVTSVKFGVVEATFTVANHSTIFATVPATPVSAAGTATTVTVTNTTGSPSTADPATADDWTWDGSAVITGMSAHAGPSGTIVTITGSGFVGVTRVRFGDTAVTYGVSDANTITATVPNTPLASLGGLTVNVVVEIGTAVSTAETPTADDWTWAAPAVITAMSHHTGPAGTVVTVTGTGFTDVTSVMVNTIAVSFTVASSTSLTFVAPAGTANGGNAVGKTQNVIVRNGSGLASTANPTNAAAWTFQ